MRSLQTRVAVAALGAVAITLAVVMFVVVSTFASSERGALDRQVKRSTTVVRAAVSDRATGTPAAGRRPGTPPAGQTPPPAVVPQRPGDRQASRPPLARRVRDVTPRTGEVVRVVTAGGRLLASAGPIVSGLPMPARAGHLVTEEAGGRTYRVFSRNARIERDRGTPVRGRVVVAADTAPMEGRIADLRDRVIVIGLLGLVLAGAIALLLARLALRSLRRLRSRAADVSATVDSDGDGRLPRGGPSEVDDLAGALNAMLDRLAAGAAAREAALDASRRFAADVGHELRTPLAALGANVDTLRAYPDIPERGEMLDELREEQRRMATLLDALQALARADAAEAIPRQPVDIADLADSAVEAAGRRHPDVAFSLVAPDGATLVDGWPDGLRLALDNLLENAARHGLPRGRVDTTVSVDGDTVTALVDDDGPGIPEAERGRVLERFARGSGARGAGSGLGLALVAQQAALHGGSLTVEEAPAGGARLRLVLGPAGS